MKYKLYLEAQISEKMNEKQKHKDIFASQADLNSHKIEAYKEFQMQEILRKREEQEKYREFLNLQVFCH